ncbi:MAG: hypothetical protein JST80_09945 [Bdellovibrionales bacterium]|nr:hypothetical protein [Bdellovibrionales bacterium]
MLRFGLKSIMILTLFSVQVPSQAMAGIAPCTQMPERTSVTTTKSSAEIPDPMKKPPSITPLGCDRPFVYKGEVYSADSPQAQDASTLREFVKSVPEADSILEDYQSNRTKSKISAYTGTVGILLALAAVPISRWIGGDSADSARTALQVGGLAIAAGGFFYSFTLLRTNEYLLPKAVDAYNAKKPNDGIELKFTTGWSF